MILGVDLGSYLVKSSLMTSFVSKVSQRGDLLSKGDYLVLQNEKFFIEEGEFDTEYRKAYRKNLLPLLYAAIAMSSDDVTNNIVLGLPLSQYKEDKDYLINRVMHSREQEIIFNGVNKKIIIEDVEVVPEGISAVDSNFEGVVIDIGGRTCDISLIVWEDGKRRIKKPYSIPRGVLNLEAEYINSINNKLGLDLFPSDAERILRSGLSIYNEHVEVGFAMNVYKEFVEGLVSQVQIDYPIKTHKIALVGGGAKRLYAPIKKRLPNSFLVEDSVFANAIGYGEIGKEIWE